MANNIAKILKDEIQRLAKKEIKAALIGLRKDNSALKHGAADMKRRLTALEAANKRLVARGRVENANGAEMAEDEVKSARITGKMVRSIRTRLGLSQNALAKLVGVSSQAVIQWEHKDGRLSFRGDTKQRIVAIRKLGKREAKDRLSGMTQTR